MDAFVARIKQALEKLGWDGSATLVAVSGGPDSVALLCVMQRLTQGASGRLIAAHFNHRLRGPDSDADESFVRTLCQQLGIPLVVGYPPSPIDKKTGGGSLEHAARLQRYRFLLRTALSYQTRYIFTAHTGDDQAETILFRILRGTGLRGLCGIPAKRVLPDGIVILRPMLELTREEVLEFLRSNQQEFRQDQSNWDCRFVRNRIRHVLLPLLEREYRPHVRRSLIRLASLAQGLYEFLQPIIERNSQEAIISRGFDHLRLNAIYLQQLPDFILGEVLQHVWEQQGWPLGQMSQKHWNRLIELVRQAVPEPGRGQPDDAPSPPRAGKEHMAFPAENRLSGQPAKKNWEGSTETVGPEIPAVDIGREKKPVVISRQVFPGNILAEIQPGILELRVR